MFDALTVVDLSFGIVVTVALAWALFGDKI